MSGARILVVDDDPGIRDVVGYALESEGYRVVSAADGDEALTRGMDGETDLVVLDVMLPGMSGFEVCRRIRERSAVPILMLSARDAELDRVMGLEVGADDYVVKPFSVPELMGRIRAMLRRRRLDREEAAGAVRRVGELRIDLGRHEVLVGGAPVSLTRSEFLLIAFLSEQPGLVLSRRAIMERLSDTPFVGDDRACDVHVFNIRRKLGIEAGAPGYVQTVRGVGYRLTPPAV